jgi:cytoskeletal protein RodZ
MQSVGTALRTAREKKSITLRQVADATRISHTNLQRLEEAKYKDLPGGVYNRAFIRAYSEFLGLDSRELLQRYELEITPPSDKTSRAKEKPVSFNEPLFKPHPLATWGLVLLISIVGLFLSRHWIARVFSPYFAHSPVSKISAPAEIGSPTGRAPAQLPAPQRAAPSTPGASASAEPPAATSQPAAKAKPPEPPPSGPPGKIRLELSVIDQCWVSINSDGNRSLVRILEPGEKHVFDAEDRIFIIIGNAGGIRLKINGKPARILGKSGEVVRLLVNEQSMKNLLEKTPD